MTMTMLAWALVWAGVAMPQATIDRILAVVNGDPITLSDVRAARTLKLVPANAPDLAVVETLVERRVVLTEMRRFQAPDPAPDVLAARRAEWAASAGGQVDVLAAAAGVSAAFVDRWLTDDLRRDAYLQQRFAALDQTRRTEAIRLWVEGLRARADVVYRIQRF